MLPGPLNFHIFRNLCNPAGLFTALQDLSPESHLMVTSSIHADGYFHRRRLAIIHLLCYIFRNNQTGAFYKNHFAPTPSPRFTMDLAGN